MPSLSDGSLQRVVLVTGPSGAGRSTAINALEDLGYEAIDNIPLNLIPRLLDGATLLRPMALGIDVRNRDFSTEALLDLQTRMSGEQGLSLELLYLDCNPEVLVRRYSETRRRHPMAPDASPTDGIAREIVLLEPVKARTDILIDTTDLTPHDLRAQVQDWFGLDTGQSMAVSVHSFSYKRGLPHGVDMVLDCRFLNNPYWQPELRGLTGMDEQVTAYVAKDPRYAQFLDHVLNLLTFQLPTSLTEGKAHFSIGFGCTGGQHRSVAVTENVALSLAQVGWQVSIRHRELERRGLMPVTERFLAKSGRSPE
ncbi:RNase adapter RapZ [Puniceibacterium sp. IMCC21224]|uniref:RNase adapter RapZ n=1 Tax=Puniceibacterium sp. IMCC21224 TaxID=1618204 RepID=UPI00064D954B|nr:RNase adapter RapZ [Puniceibacterium sp. IMCC21224]KMK66075.1 putative P-loop-containing kinase [Puniceibacterium sp. IMCC21224]